MVVRSRGFRQKTRRKLKGSSKQKFKVTPFLQEFKLNDKVVINHSSYSHVGMPDPKFKGRIGLVTGKRGSSYIITIKDGKKVKNLIARPEHLKIHR